jgi:flagellar basal-body rod modification protein FlgD
METSALDALRTVNSQTSAVPKQEGSVDKASFLTLLVTQLRNQDPLEPVENTEFISQLATFQSLESQIAMGDRLEDLVGLQESQLALAGLSQAALLVGKHVTWDDADGNLHSGTIQTVTVENGVMMVNTENGKVPVGALTSIGLAPATPQNGEPPEPPAGGTPPTTPTTPTFTTSAGSGPASLQTNS